MRTQNKLAANATVWMAAPSITRQGAQVRATTVNREILRYLALCFGGLNLMLLILAAVFAGLGETSWKSVFWILAFSIINIGFFFYAYRFSHPYRALIAQTILGGVLCPLVYLQTDGILAAWWPAYAIMGLSASVAWCLHSSKPAFGRYVLLYYLANLALAAFLTTILGKTQPHLHTLGLQIGLIGLTGLLLVQLTEILSQSLSKVYERSIQHRKAKEDLQELTRLKEDFFANISHEFRTPITLTLGPLEAVLKGRHGEIGAELRNQIGTMIRNQQRLLALINQILDISKVTAGAILLKAARIPDFNAFVLERVDSFRATLEARKLSLKHSLDPLVKGMEIYIDREKFDKILLNLLSNSLKFTKQGGIEVVTEVQGDRVLLKVSDTGIGIKESELPHVFDRFRQADGSATREFAGTGLGLALVQEFAKLHGGDVTVTSRYGQGTTFQVMLKLGRGHLSPSTIVDFIEDESAPAAMAPAEPVDLENARANCAELNLEVARLYDSGKPTIVCAEDNPELRYFLRDMLIDGYNVFVGANGRDALELVRQHHPDLILSDLMMPVMSGLDFCRKIKEEPTLSPIPFVLLTARSMTSSKLEGLEEGADDYLTKPFSESELLARVRNLVKLRRQQLKLERELEAARAIQVSLLPPVPQRFEAAVLDFFYHPTAELSGDFCDILPKGDWVYFYLADVTSHGTASAQVTYLVKEIFWQLVESGTAESSLVDLIREAQRRYATHRLEYDVALQLARFHLGKKTLEILRSSSPAPIKISGTEAPQSLRVKPSPSLTAEAPPAPEAFQPAEFTLAPGDAVYFFTDGCYEFPAGEGEFGLKRFHSVLAAATNPENWKEEIFQAMAKAHGGNSFPDDITFLKLKVM